MTQTTYTIHYPMTVIQTQRTSMAARAREMGRKVTAEIEP